MKSRNMTETLYKYLRDPEFAANYLNEIIEDGDMPEMLLALRDIAKAREGGMSAVATNTDFSRGSLYKSLSESGNPLFSSVLDITRTFGLNIKFEAANSDRAAH